MYDLESYPAMKVAMARWDGVIGHEDRIALANKLVNQYDCPCIVAAYLVGDAYGYNEPLNNWISVLEGFSPNNKIVRKDV